MKQILSSYRLITVVITSLLFVVPFFWFKPGQMDLGGDSSRLYFYDPISYLKNYSLYGVSPSGLGAENVGYFSLPLVAILALVKSIVKSPTILITAFHGMSLAVSFFATYRSSRELAVDDESAKEWAKQSSSILAGLLYVLSPVAVSGWDKVLMTHNYVFLNPLMFYLLLRYIRTQAVAYLLWTLVVTVVFSANFSFAAAPVFFAFYPLTVAFLAVYSYAVLGRGLLWRHIFWAFLAFVGLQSFHLIPQVVSMFSPGSVLYTTVFSSEGKFDRGLRYFSAIAPNVKASLNMLLLPQAGNVPKSLLVSAVLPMAVVAGLVLNRKRREQSRKSMLLVSVYFLIALFFATANITRSGLELYKKLFVIPGFSIFRNFYGQWAGTFLFVYSLLFGQALSLLLGRMRYGRVVIVAFSVILVVSARSFLTGELVNKVLWQSRNVRIATVMDGAFAEALSYLHALPEGRVLTLPLTDSGYQIVAGKYGGAYQGPSMVAYLAGKQDFAGFDELGRYKELILNLVRQERYDELIDVLRLLNVRYIFHNADPQVYDESFPAFPYEHVRRFLPETQADYRALLSQLPLERLAVFGERFFVFKIVDRYSLPEIFVPDTVMYFDKPVADWSKPLSLVDNSKLPAFIESQGSPSAVGERYAVLDPESPLLVAVKNPDHAIVMHHSFVTTPPWSPVYPLVMVKEAAMLLRHGRGNYEYHVDRRLFLSAKRVLELEKWGKRIPMLRTVSQADELRIIYSPCVQRPLSFFNVNSWEATLSRYVTLVSESIAIVDSSPAPKWWKLHQRFLIGEYLLKHHARLTKVIRKLELSSDVSVYLETLVDDMMEMLETQAGLPKFSHRQVIYQAGKLCCKGDELEILVAKDKLEQETFSLRVAGKEVALPQDQTRSGWISFSPLVIDGKDEPQEVELVMPTMNLLSPASLVSPHVIAADATRATLRAATPFLKGGGLAFEISRWQEDSYYVLTFDYTTAGEPFILRVFEMLTDTGGRRATRLLVEDQLKSRRWRRYQAVLRSDMYSDGAIIHITTGENVAVPSSIEVKNQSFSHVPHPTILLKSSTSEAYTPSGSIRYAAEKQNPTRYLVRISAAVAPYYLVLHQAYSPRWRLTVVDQQGQAGFWGQLLSWFAHPVSVKRHYGVNAEFNAWYITPEDAAGKTDYVLRIEMVLQRYFLIGAGISFTMFAGVVGFGLYAAVKRLRT